MCDFKQKVKAHSGPVNAIALLTTSPHFISASVDHTLKVWDWPHGQLVCSLEGHSGPVMAVAVSPSDKYIISASALVPAP